MGNLAQATIQAQQKAVAGQKIATGHPQGMPLHGSILQHAAILPAMTPVHSGILQRCSGGVECAECRERRLEREGMIQRAAVSAAPVNGNGVPPMVHEVLGSPGQPLDAGTRAFMEPKFGYDFSGVRVHTDARAAESARAVNALAYTVGRDMVFGAGRYAPETSEGRKLMAHELTHVVQHRSGGCFQKLSAIGEPTGSAEVEAELMASNIMSDLPVKDISPVENGILQRQLLETGTATAAKTAAGSTLGAALAGILAGAVVLFWPSPIAPEPRIAPQPQPQPRSQREEDCRHTYPEVDECWLLELEHNYEYADHDLKSARETAFESLQRSNRSAQLEAFNIDRESTDGPCPGQGTHTNVRDLNSLGGDNYFGSIVCCPCCIDEPTGPELEARCGFVPH